MPDKLNWHAFGDRTYAHSYSVLTRVSNICSQVYSAYPGIEHMLLQMVPPKTLCVGFQIVLKHGWGQHQTALGL